MNAITQLMSGMVVATVLAGCGSGSATAPQDARTHVAAAADAGDTAVDFDLPASFLTWLIATEPAVEETKRGSRACHTAGYGGVETEVPRSCLE